MKHIALLLTLGIITATFAGCETTRKTRHYEEHTTTVGDGCEACSCHGHHGDSKKDKPRRTVTTEQTSTAPEIVVE